QDRTVADEPLLPAEGVAAVDPPGVRGDRRRVRSGTRLRDGEPAYRGLPLAQARQPPTLLLADPHREQRTSEEPSLQDDLRDRAVAPSQLLHDRAHRVQARDSPTSVFRGD